MLEFIDPAILGRVAKSPLYDSMSGRKGDTPCTNARPRERRFEVYSGTCTTPYIQQKTMRISANESVGINTVKQLRWEIKPAKTMKEIIKVVLCCSDVIFQRAASCRE